MAQRQQEIRPEQIDRLPFLTAEKKTQYKGYLVKLWNDYNTSPDGSPQKAGAENHIRKFSQQIMTELASHTSKNKNQAQGQNGASAQAQQYPQQQAQQMQRPPTQGSMGGQQNGQQQTLAQKNGVSEAHLREVQSHTIHIPHNIPAEQRAKYKEQWFTQALNCMRARDQWITKGKQAQLAISQANAAGQAAPQWQAMIEAAKKGVNESGQKWQNMKARNEQTRQANLQAQQQQQAVTGGQPQSHEMQRTNTNGSNQGQQNVKVESRPSTSPTQPQHGFQQTQQSQPQQNNQNVPPNMGNPPQQQVQTPQTTTQPQPPQQNFQQSQNMTQAQAQQQYQQRMQQQHQALPQQQVPQQQQSAQRPQIPQALSQSDAIARTRESYTQQGQQMPGNGPQSNAPQQPNGMPFNAASNHNNQNTPSSAYPGQGAPSLQQTPISQNQKPQISKQLQIDPRINQPVPMQQARPTMGGANAGMMGQPGLARAPTYTLEGEGDHVLSKRKLDELVRQVTGSASSTANGDQSATASMLDPAVEENILALADDFVDDLVTSACKLAKLRPDRMLDIKDIQLVLERNYGIRIPGYALEEQRTVRKFQPAPGWQGKMQAIQTAKTLGGKADA